MKKTDIEYNGQIFTCQKIINIDITSMIELLAALSKKQQYTDKKLEYLDKKLNFFDERIKDKDQRISDLEIKINGESKSKEENFPSEEEYLKEIEKDKDTNEGQNGSGDNNQNDNNENNKKKRKKKKKSKKEENGENDGEEEEEEEDYENGEEDGEDKDIGYKGETTEKQKQKELDKEIQDKINKSFDNEFKDLENNSPNDNIKKILKRLKTIEYKLANLERLYNVSSTSKKTTIIGNRRQLNDEMNKKLEEMEKKMNEMKEEMAKLKEKVEDFNVYDLLKNESGDPDFDLYKGLIMALEKKVYKRFENYDARFKKDEADIFQNQTDIKNINATINGMKDRENKMNDEMNEMKYNNQAKFVDINKLLKELNEKINKLDENVNKNIKTNSDEHKEFYDKLKSLEQKFNKQDNGLNINFEKGDGNSNLNDIELLKDLSKKVIEIEKYLKANFKNFNPNEIIERLNKLEEEMLKKANKYDLNEINEKLALYDENEKDINLKLDTLQQYNEKLREDMKNIIKKIEYFAGELNRLMEEVENRDKGKGSSFDASKLVDINSFNDNKKDVNKKFDKIRLSFEEIAKNLDDILEKLSHTPSDKDFAQFQTIIKNMIDELKIHNNKKFADKSETNKTLKFIETQIKSINETLTRRSEGADNWLLAKKPLNNFCASCESIIRGELDKRSEYIPWNRYPNREDKSYRLGHGFSRMLQMLTDDKLKYGTEKENNSDQEKSRSDSEQNMVVNGNVKLPKLKDKTIDPIRIKKNVSMNNYDENNLPFNRNSANAPYESIDSFNSMDRPKIMKIYKKTNKTKFNSFYQDRKDMYKSSNNLSTEPMKTVPNDIDREPNHAIRPETLTQNNEE